MFTVNSGFRDLSAADLPVLRANFRQQIDGHKADGNDDGCEKEEHGELE